MASLVFKFYKIQFYLGLRFLFRQGSLRYFPRLPNQLWRGIPLCIPHPIARCQRLWHWTAWPTHFSDASAAHVINHLLIQVITVYNDFNECCVVFDVGIALCVKRCQRHQQRTAACNVHFGRRTFKRWACWIRSKRVDNMFTTVLINEHQCYLKHRVTC